MPPKSSRHLRRTGILLRVGLILPLYRLAEFLTLLRPESEKGLPEFEPLQWEMVDKDYI